MKLFYCFLFFFSCSSLENKRIILPEGQDHLVKKYGRIHRSCLDRFGSKLIQIIDSSVMEGMSCLGKLKGAGARKNEKRLTELFETKKLTFICHEKNADWENVFARASFDSTYDLPELGTKHPYISFNPNLALKDSHFKGRAVDPEHVEMVIFHELFHDIGYLHGKNPEYPYACGACCFLHDEDKAEACRICSDEYTGIDDPEYIKRLWAWAPRNRYGKTIAKHFVVRNAIFVTKRKKHSLYEYLSHDFTEGNLSLQKLLKEARRRGYLIGNKGEAFINKDFSHAQDIFKLSEAVGKAEIALYLDKNLIKATKFFMGLDEKILRDAFKREKNQQVIFNLWDSILYDMDVILVVNYGKKSYINIHKKYLKIKSTAPIKS